jgi:hypothetical protein
MSMATAMDLNSIKSFSNFNFDEFNSKQNFKITSNYNSKIKTPNGIDILSSSSREKIKTKTDTKLYKFNINNNLHTTNSQILSENEFNYTPNNSRPNSRKRNLKPIISNTPLYQSANINISNSQYKI